jgi:hypothetical protein
MFIQGLVSWHSQCFGYVPINTPAAQLTAGTPKKQQ